jgi:uncharacterized RDD family membrane protein YckC/energy-coupling factor transporter ATP-binding protein EcfA2
MSSTARTNDTAYAAGAPLAANPFPGLRPFEEEEEHLFFGRERQVDNMINKLAKSHFLAVVGTSGSGKSSLVNCGLRPALHRGLMTSAGPIWRMAQFRPGNDPLRALTRALSADDVLYSGYKGDIPLEEIVDTHLRLSKRGLIEIFRKARVPEPANLLIVADQFEELFRYRHMGAAYRKSQYGAGEDAVAFVNLLLEVPAQLASRIYVVLTMRSDFLGDCSQFEGLPEAINEGQYLVPRLTREERRAAIAGPIGTGGADTSPVLLTRLVNDVGDNPDQLSILQHALNRTWAYWEHQRQAEGALSLPDYEAIGTMAHALDWHAEKAYGELTGERQQKICQKIFQALTDKGTDARGIRRPTSLKTLCAIAGASQEEMTAVINVFRKPSRSFLMPPLPEALEPDTVIDISHESLMRVWERLKKWADEEARSARMYRRLAETATLHAAGGAGLWGDPDLQLALDWQRNAEPNAAWAELYRGDFTSAMAFLEKSKAERDKDTAELEFERLWRRVAQWFAAGSIFFFLLLIFQLHPRIEAITRQVSDWLDKDGDSWHAFIEAMATSFVCIPGLLGYLAVASYGKQILHRMAFPRIVREVANRQAKLNEAQRLALEPAAESVAQRAIDYAKYPRRLVATLIDGVIFFSEVMVVFVLGSAIAPSLDSVWFFWAGFGVDWVFDAWMVSSRRQATPGKWIAGIMVTDEKGARLSFARASGRRVAKLLSYYSVVGLFLPLMTRKHQSIHDFLVKSVVVRRPAKKRLLDS